MVTVPLRVEVAVFAATLYATEPSPDPLAPLVTVIHATLLVAVHAQPVSDVTATEPVPPPAGTDWLVGAIV